MKKHLPLLFLLTFFYANLNAQVSFYKIHLNNEINSRIFDMVSLTDGTFATIGVSENQNGSVHVALTKLDCKGDVAWAKNLGNSDNIGNVYTSVEQADNGDLVFINSVGVFQNYDILVGRITLDGDLLWKKRYGGSRDDNGASIVQMDDGNFVVFGSTNSFGTDTNGSLSYNDLYLMKLDGENGNVLWSKTLGNSGSIERGYAMTKDNDDNIYMTGGYLVDGTFYSFILKTDTDGNILLFKGYGAGNHRTNGRGIAVTPEGDIAITGSTTIAKDNFMSLPDVFLVKTDAEGMPYFTNIYYSWIGSDNSDGGASLVVQDDGGIGIGVSTQSFSNWSQGFVPNKNAVFSTNVDGMLEKAVLYNQGGSHYTNISKAVDGGVILSAFSNFYSTSFEFIPLLVKMNSDYEGVCNEIMVTSEISTFDEMWDVQDISYVEGEGSEDFSYSFEADFSYSDVNTQCETIPEAEAIFTVSPNVDEPQATFDFTDMSIGVGTYSWDFGDGITSTEQNPTHSYSETGDYEVCMTLFANCDTSMMCTTVEVTMLPTGITRLEKRNLKVYPNPVGDQLKVEWGTVTAPQCLDIYDAQGKLLFRDKTLPATGSELLPFGDFPQGVYFIQAYFKNGVIGKQVVKG